MVRSFQWFGGFVSLNAPGDITPACAVAPGALLEQAVARPPPVEGRGAAAGAQRGSAAVAPLQAVSAR
jgi:hypothetical protein